VASSRKSNFIWPDVSTLDGARSACRTGAAFAVIVAVLTGGVAILAALGVHLFPTSVFDASALIDAALFAVVAWGLYRYSRVAAVAGLVIYLAERVYMIASGVTGGIPLAIIMTIGLLGAVRGAFAHHRLSKQAPAAA